MYLSIFTKTILILIILLFNTSVFSQSIAVCANPTLGTRIINAKQNPSFPKDSLSKTDQFAKSLGFGLRYNYEKPTYTISFGFNYSPYGFDRVISNYQFKDTVHPSIGWVKDLSQGAVKIAYFKYRWTYFSLPIQYAKQITSKNRNREYRGMFGFGINPKILFTNASKVHLEGFSVNQKSDFIITDTYFENSKFGLDISLFGRYDYHLSNKWWLTSTISLYADVLSNAKHLNAKYYNIGVLCNFGIKIDI